MSYDTLQQEEVLVDTDNSKDSPVISSIKSAIKAIDTELAKDASHYDSGSSGEERATELRIINHTRFYDTEDLLAKKAKLIRRLNNPIVHCIKCGDRIEEQRLEIIPETDNCRTCATQAKPTGFQNQRKSYAYSQP